MEQPAPLPLTVTLLTPLAQGGLAAVRVVGERTRELLAAMVEGELPADPSRLTLAKLRDPATGEVLDEAIVRMLPGGAALPTLAALPAIATLLGAELTLHGGIRIVQRVISACQAAGAVRLDLSRAGDYEPLWRQSLLLARAEGRRRPALWADIELSLPRARTQLVADWLIGQWGEGSGRTIEALIDREEAPNSKLRAEVLEGLLAGYPTARKLIEGVRIAIVGPANAGKSTLFNTLGGSEAAIVADMPGTTRDYVSRWASLAGLPAELIDTPGLRTSPGELESRAAALAARAVRDANLRVIVLDQTTPLAAEGAAAVLGLAGVGPVLWAVNKSDSPTRWQPAEWLAKLNRPGEMATISAATGQGVGELIQAIWRSLGIPAIAPGQAALFTARQAALAEKAVVSDSSERVAALSELLDGCRTAQ